MWAEVTGLPFSLGKKYTSFLRALLWGASSTPCAIFLRAPTPNAHFRQAGRGTLCVTHSLLQEPISGASLVAQWLRVCLPMQGTRVRALVREDPTRRGATKPVRHNY